MALFGPYVHDLDPIIASVLGVHLWWYGLSYTLGFLNVHLFLRRQRARLGLSLAAVHDLTLWLAVGVLVGGRLVVVNNEWMFYREHLSLIPAIWIGGLATHGLKNLLLIPVLLWVRKQGAPPGRLAALFVFLYSTLRVPIDLLRDYPVTLMGLPAGQTFNILMSVAGAILLLRN